MQCLRETLDRTVSLDAFIYNEPGTNESAGIIGDLSRIRGAAHETDICCADLTRKISFIVRVNIRAYERVVVITGTISQLFTVWNNNRNEK